MQRIKRNSVFTFVRSAHNISIAAAPLNASVRAVRAHLQVTLDHTKHPTHSVHDVKRLLQDAEKLRDSELIHDIVSNCVAQSGFSKETFVLALECYRSIDDPRSAVELYEKMTLAQPSLKGASSLALLVSILSRASPEMAQKGVELYTAALQDPLFDGLHADQRVAIAALGLFLKIQPSPESLSAAIFIKSRLLQAGIRLSSGIYATLIKVSGRMRSYEICKQLYEESVVAGIANNVATEAALLEAALHADAYSDCVDIYMRLQAQGSHMLNSSVVASMLEVFVRTGEPQLGLSVITQWHSSGGALTWRICRAALDLFLTPALVAKLTHYTAPSTAWTVIPFALPSAGAGTVSQRNKQAEGMKAVVVDAVLKQVLQSLKDFQRRSAYLQKQNLGLESLLREDPSKLSVVPLDILARLSGLIAIQREVDLLLARVEAPGVTLQQHQRVVSACALELVELGRWRELVSLNKRLTAYNWPQDALYYDAQAMLHMHAYTFVCLLRAGQTGRAQDLARSHIVPLIGGAGGVDAGKNEPFSVLLEALEATGASGMSAELAVIAQQALVHLELKRAQALAQAVLLQCATVSDLLLCLSSLSAGAASSSDVGTSAAPSERFCLTERHLDLVEGILCNASSEEDKASAAQCRALVEALSTHEPVL